MTTTDQMRDLHNTPAACDLWLKGDGLVFELDTVRAHKITMDLNSGAGKMYDFPTDPDEMLNLFDVTEAAALLAVLPDYIASRPKDMLPDQMPIRTA